MATCPGHLEAGGCGQVAYEAHKNVSVKYHGFSNFFFPTLERKKKSPTQPVSLGHTQRAEAHTQLVTAPAGHTDIWLWKEDEEEMVPFI